VSGCSDDEIDVTVAVLIASLDHGGSEALAARSMQRAQHLLSVRGESERTPREREQECLEFHGEVLW
jgi:hypothetical protein